MSAPGRNALLPVLALNRFLNLRIPVFGVDSTADIRANDPNGDFGSIALSSGRFDGLGPYGRS
jgi:hypothetical protein